MRLNKALKTNIEILKNLYQNPKSLEWNKDFIFKNKFQPAFILIRGISNFNNSEIYRARTIAENEDLSNINTYSYPPIEYNNLDRTNLKSKQVLYSSNCPTTSILEYLNTGNAEETVYLSAWKFQKRKGIQTFYINKFEENLDYLKWKIGKNANNETLKLIKEIFEYLILLYKSKNYNLSAPLSHFLLYTHNICDMIKYPSVVTDSQSYNCALNIDFFKKEFVLNRVYKINVLGKIDMGKLEEKSDLKIVMKPIEIGKNINNKIIFEPFKENKDNFWKDYIELKI